MFEGIIQVPHMSKTADLPPPVKEVLEALRGNFNILKIFLRDIRRTVKRDTATKIVSLGTAMSSFLPALLLIHKFLVI